MKRSTFLQFTEGPETLVTLNKPNVEGSVKQYFEETLKGDTEVLLNKSLLEFPLGWGCVKRLRERERKQSS